MMIFHSCVSLPESNAQNNFSPYFEFGFCVSIFVGVDVYKYHHYYCCHCNKADNDTGSTLTMIALTMMIIQCDH